MQISFDPNDPQDVDSVEKIIILLTSDNPRAAAVAMLPSTEAQDAPVAVAATPVPNETAAVDPAPVSPTVAPAPEQDARIGVELDANGTPWLEEVHAGTKSKTATGIWKKRRGTDDAVVKAAEEAARAKLAGTPEPVTPTETAAEQPVETVESIAPVSLDELANTYQQAVDAGVVTADEILGLYSQCGCASPEEIATNETARAKVVGILNERLTANAPAAAPGLPGLPG